jgi:transposase
MQPLTEGYRYHALTSTYGGVAQRWLLIVSEPRQPQARRTVDKQLLRQSDQELKAWKKLCSTAFACEADAQQALARFAHGMQDTYIHTSMVRAQPRSGKRGRPGRDAQPAQVFYQVDGALASSLAARQGLIDQHSCFLLATNALDETQRSPQEV